MTTRIALIHATRAAIAPIETAFSEVWPEAEQWSLLDEDLNQSLNQAGELTEKLGDRFIRLASYAADTSIDGLLFTCTAFGPLIEECQRRFPFPTLKPNEAMFETAIESGLNIGLLASHPVALPELTAQLSTLAKKQSHEITITPQLVAGAWDALAAGNQEVHDHMVINAAQNLHKCDVVLLAQFSMAPLAKAIQSTLSSKVITSPHAAVSKLRRVLNQR